MGGAIGTRLTRDEAAARINGREYLQEITKGLAAEMKASGLVAIFGSSDDLLEFAGAISEEVGAYSGALVHISPKGNVIPDDSDIPESVGSIWVEATRSPNGIEASWLITSEAAGSPFDIMEDGELFCRGLVIDLGETFAAHHKAEAIRKAAPDLYEVVRQLLERQIAAGSMAVDDETLIEMARAAIAKAEGRPSPQTETDTGNDHGG